MIKKAFSLLFIVCLAYHSSSVFVSAQDSLKASARKAVAKYTPDAKPFELTGEVVDSWCYSSQTMGPGRGEQHKACALACAHGGVTLGIVDDEGTLYIAAKHRGYTGCQDLLMPFVAKRVKIVGWLARKGGCNILKIKSVQLVK